MGGVMDELSIIGTEMLMREDRMFMMKGEAAPKCHYGAC